MVWTDFHSAPSRTANRDRPTDAILVVGMADVEAAGDDDDDDNAWHWWFWVAQFGEAARNNAHTKNTDRIVSVVDRNRNRNDGFGGGDEVDNGCIVVLRVIAISA